MHHEVWQALTRFEMLQPGDRVCVALSGGADSVALLSFLRDHALELGVELSACHLNHGLRGEESQRDENFVTTLCGRWDIPLTVERLPIGELAQAGRLSVEECGRRERYRLFARLRQETGCKVATAHTRSDSMETMLLNLARGAGLRGLAGIPPTREGIIRPLIFCTRRQVEAYCAAQGLSYVTDSSNLGDEYARNVIRHRAVPALYQVNPAADRAMARMMETAAETDDFLEKLAAQAEEDLRLERGWSRAGLLALERPVARQLLARLARGQGETLTAGQWERCFALAERGGAEELSGRTVFRARGDTFGFYPKETPSQPAAFFQPVTLPTEPTVVHCPSIGKRVALTPLIYEQKMNFDGVHPLDLKNQVDYDKLYGTVILRTRLAGDVFHPAGRGCGKTLKKWFNEAAVPLSERGRLLVLADDRGVLWVEGFGPDERAALRPDTRRRLLIQCAAAEDMTHVRDEE